MRAPPLITALTALLVNTAVAQAPSPWKWGPAPPSFPPGAKLAVLQGDPGQSALFTVRLDMPAGYKLPPHFHPTDESVTVIQGTFLIGMGDKLDVAHASPLKPGAFVTAGAGRPHFWGGRGRAIAPMHGRGGLAPPPVKPAGDPPGKQAPRTPPPPPLPLM